MAIICLVNNKTYAEDVKCEDDPRACFDGFKPDDTVVTDVVIGIGASRVFTSLSWDTKVEPERVTWNHIWELVRLHREYTGVDVEYNTKKIVYPCGVERSLLSF